MGENRKTVKTSITIPADLLRSAEAEAARDGRSLSNFITWALRRQIAGQIEIPIPRPESANS